jgi:hypothetical protein
MAYFIPRIKVPDYDAWKPNFDADDPGARRDGKSHRILRGVDDPSDVYILVEFASAEAAREGRERLLASGVLNRFPEHSGPIVVDSGGAG